MIDSRCSLRIVLKMSGSEFRHKKCKKCINLRLNFARLYLCSVCITTIYTKIHTSIHKCVCINLFVYTLYGVSKKYVYIQ